MKKRGWLFWLYGYCSSAESTVANKYQSFTLIFFFLSFFYSLLTVLANAYAIGEFHTQQRNPQGRPISIQRQWRVDEDNPVRRRRRSGSFGGGGWVDRLRVVLMGLICVCLVDGLISSVCWVWSFDGFDFFFFTWVYGFGFTVLIFSLMGLLGFKKMNHGLIGSG